MTRQLRGAVHVHSSWSYDAKVPLDELARAFAKRGYDVVFMCEHDRGFSASQWSDYQAACAEASGNGVLLVPGIEYADPEDRVHIPVWGCAPFLGEGLPTTELLTEVRKAGGFAILAHPRRRDIWDAVDPAWYELLDGIEVWSRKWDGWAPNARSSDVAGDHGLVPIASLDLHRMNQFFPLSVRLEVSEPPSVESAVRALSLGRPEILRMPVRMVTNGIAGRCIARGEVLRRGLLRRLRR
jgi:hypothetical protein